jgi:hypothetical protein
LYLIDTQDLLPKENPKRFENYKQLIFFNNMIINTKFFLNLNLKIHDIIFAW